MQLPFTSEQFFEVFKQYNEALWPAQIGIYLAAVIVFYLIFKPGRYSNKIIAGILALLWMWMGIVYHWGFFSQINPAARIFGILFILQGLIFIYEGLVRNNLEFSYSKNSRSITGLILILFGTIIYPILGQFLGHNYPGTPTFGLPCPTTIFTFGVLLLTLRAPKYVVLIPLLWSGIGFLAAISLGVKEDVSLLLAGLIGTSFLLFKKPGETYNKETKNFGSY